MRLEQKAEEDWGIVKSMSLSYMAKVTDQIHNACARG